MKAYPKYPSLTQLRQFLEQQGNANFSYKEIGASKATFPKGYNHDRIEVLLGEGPEVWLAGKSAIESWAMFPKGWTRLFPEKVPIQPGEVVVVVFRMLGLWWLNSCRIVYVIDEPNRFGFAYGTLDQHVEKGEEIFEVYREKDGKVWYRLSAFSKPSRWYVWLGYPLARLAQARFRRESGREMVIEVELASA